MPGNMTVTDYTAFPIKAVRYSWTADYFGNVTGNSGQSYYGQVMALVTIPGGVLPQDQYDITITDQNGYDVCQGNGSNLGNSSIQTRCTAVSSPVFGNLTLNVSAAGNSSTGHAILYIKKPS